MTEEQAAKEIASDVANAWTVFPRELSTMWRAVWTLASDTAKTHLIAAAMEQDAEHPETAGRMPWASDVARWAEGQREVARV